MKQDIINRLLLQVEEKLESLHFAMQMEDEITQAEVTEELATLHATLRALGHFPSSLKVEPEKVSV